MPTCSAHLEAVDQLHQATVGGQQGIGAPVGLLAAGDQVIVEGLQKVKEGAPAKGVTAEQAAAAKAAQAKPAPTQGKAE